MADAKRYARVGIAGFVLSTLGVASPAFGFVDAIWGYVKQYQVGIDYTSSYDEVNATYDTAFEGEPAEGCEAVGDAEEGKQRCRVTMEGGRSSGVGLFLQQAFKRQGNFYFKPNLGFGLRYLSGELDEKQQVEQEERGLPLRVMRFSLAAVVIKPSLTFGITPASRWPDLLISIGPAAQVAFGRVKVNDEAKSTAIATSSGLLSGFFEVEAVFARFGEGALSVFFSQDFTGDGEGTKFYPETIDGMDNIRANFRRSVGGANDASFYGFGAKLVLDWP